MHERRRLSADEVLFQTGESGDIAFLIESGAIEIYLEHEDGAESIARLQAGDLFGEMALAGNHTRTACARALGDTELLVVSHELLNEQMARATPVLRHLLRVTLARSRDLLQRLQQSSTAEPTPSARYTGSEHVDHELAVQRLRTEQALREALRDDGLQLHYQPIVDLASGAIAGFEALIRWYDPAGRPIPPSSFIGIAEDSGLIVEIGHWIIDTATAALEEMGGVRSDAPPFCSINLSPWQFDDPQLFPRIRDALLRHALDPRRLRLEITESAAFGDPDAVRRLLDQCRALGCALLVDDFGTGYSSLSYLHRLPIDAIKLDRSFIDDLDENRGAAAIVRAITGLAADLGMYTVAEGIETAAQSAACARYGVHYGQGYHFSRGVPLADALALLSAPPIAPATTPKTL